MHTDSRCSLHMHAYTQEQVAPALWQSSPTPAPLNYSRHAVESFTQSFSYINATQRDCPLHGQFRGLAGCFERQRDAGHGDTADQRNVRERQRESLGQVGTRMLLCFATRDPLGSLSVSLPCWFHVISLWWRYNSSADARRLDSLWRGAPTRTDATVRASSTDTELFLPSGVRKTIQGCFFGLPLEWNDLFLQWQTSYLLFFFFEYILELLITANLYYTSLESNLKKDRNLATY